MNVAMTCLQNITRLKNKDDYARISFQDHLEKMEQMEMKDQLEQLD